ncbi:hypothetical protein ACFVFH_32170 [Streptomyces sp. NPDC057697]|uniref:hypothetical protein n=1 Tax=Streptomyces sp. NPDC057697 TaxID=3346219 RepID=UPI0036A09DED
MAEKAVVPVGVRLTTDIEYRPDRPNPYLARVRWFDPATKRRLSLSEGKADEDEAQEWFQSIIEAAEAGLSPSLATVKLAEYGNANMDLALRGLELKTLDPYLAGWRDACRARPGPRRGPDDHQRRCRPHRAELDRRRAQPINGEEHHRRPGPCHGAGSP